MNQHPNEIRSNTEQLDEAFFKGYQVAYQHFRGKTLVVEDINFSYYMTVKFTNPYDVNGCGNFGKKLKASWHNGFRAGAKNAVIKD